MLCQLQRWATYCSVLGPGYSLLHTGGQWRAPSGEEEEETATAPWPQQLQLSRGTAHAGSSHPCAEEGMQDKISSLSEGWQSKALRTGGGGRAREKSPGPCPQVSCEMCEKVPAAS